MLVISARNISSSLPNSSLCAVIGYFLAHQEENTGTERNIRLKLHQKVSDDTHRKQFSYSDKTVSALIDKIII